MTTLWIDLETYSECPLKTHGTYVYAEHPSTRILLCAFAINDGDVQIYDVKSQIMPLELTFALQAKDTIFIAHNSQFDRVILESQGWIAKGLYAQWHDTMVQALAHSLPASLSELGIALKLDSDKQKDKRGARLIQMFCKPTRYTPETHAAEWEEFKEYAMQDVETMRQCYKLLPKWNYPNNVIELLTWQLDQQINDTGFYVDTALAHSAIKADAAAKDALNKEMSTITSYVIQSGSKRQQLLKYLINIHASNLTDLKAATVKDALKDKTLSDSVRLILENRMAISKTTSAKYQNVINRATTDSRIKGSLQYCGASRTGRWAGRGFQPQNLARPREKEKAVNFNIDAIKADCIDIMHSDVSQALSDAVRGCISAPQGKKLLVSDLSNIEGRVLVWLAGEEWKLKYFYDYDAGRIEYDNYVMAYSKMFNVEPPNVTKNDRQQGKVAELALGYGSGVGGFLAMASGYGMDIADLAKKTWESADERMLLSADSKFEWAEEKGFSGGLTQYEYAACETLKVLWREAHPQVVQLWGELEDCFRMAINTNNQVFKTRTGLLKCKRQGHWLMMQLPSKRCLSYYQPRIDEKDGAITVGGVDQLTRKWGRQYVYGGLLVENATQAVARDVLSANLCVIANAGLKPVLTVHDEVLCEVDDDPTLLADNLSIMLATLPQWATGLPLAAAGYEAYRYKKED
jgi:DNA polymerase